ncbi:MAG: ABC transporter ATP-binding protein [Acetobacteraceae bacterium]|jgi:peptide/nickel transport system ATP-binding protein
MDEIQTTMHDALSGLHRPLLEIAGLSVAYPTSRGWLRALDDVSLSIPAGAVLGLVGESGSGKSSVVMALLGLLGSSARVRAAHMAFDGQDLLTRAPSLRGRRIGVVFQDTSAVLNPALTIGSQVAEPLLVHRRLRRSEAWSRATELLAEMGIARPAQVMHCYPHQLSGGMKQRVGIATALASEPDLLLLDEPTTALDVTVEAQILDLLDGLRVRHGLSMLLVSHNLAIVDRLCDRVAVLYAGRVTETGAAASVFSRPRHPYTKGLLAALPRPHLAHPGRLSPIAGRLPDLVATDPGCNFRPRCAFAGTGCEQPQALLGHDHQARCHRVGEIARMPWPAEVSHGSPVPFRKRSVVRSEHPEAPLVQATGLSRAFTTGGLLQGLFGKGGRGVLAVDDVSLAIRPGEIVGLVGESGCGKSTLGRLLLRLVPPDAGRLRFDGTDIAARPGLDFRRRAQIVFQNPDTSLNPRQTVGAILRRPLRRFGIARGGAEALEIGRLLELVRLPPGFADRYPHQLSGGEKQRVGIARALATRPDFLVCDETVSALDVSVQAVVLNLLRDLRDELGVAYLFISHDIGVIAHIADRVAVMYQGSLVEEGGVRDVLHPPYHPYTEALLCSVPIIGKRRGPTDELRSTKEADGSATVSGCKFSGRCPRKQGPICDTAPPPWQEVDRGHRIRCHIPLATLNDVPPWLPARLPADAAHG